MLQRGGGVGCLTQRQSGLTGPRECRWGGGRSWQGRVGGTGLETVQPEQRAALSQPKRTHSPLADAKRERQGLAIRSRIRESPVRASLRPSHTPLSTRVDSSPRERRHIQGQGFPCPSCDASRDATAGNSSQTSEEQLTCSRGAARRASVRLSLFPESDQVRGDSRW